MKETKIDTIREEILALFSHELKTPLTLITGWCQVMQSPKIVGRLKKDQLHAVDVIYSNVLKLKSDIEDILDTNKLIYGTMLFSFDTIDVDRLIQRTIRKLKPLTDEKNIKVINLGREKIMLRTDPDRLQQVLVNMVLNAVDFVPRNKGVIKIGTKQDDDQVIFYVMDNGRGLPKKIQKNIFEKLVQEDSSYRRRHGGLGLGLFICQGIVESLGGTIHVDSRMGKGATFYFTHPKYGNVARFSLLRQKKHMAVSELYSLVEKTRHDQRENEMIRRLREYIEKMKNDEFLKSLDKIKQVQ